MTELTDRQGMEPTRNPQVTLPDLIEVLLNRGAYLNLDLIISVADIPLIGVNLRATIAGMETMLEYGMLREWDERTRAWVAQSVSRNFPLRDGEEVVAKVAGGHFQEDFARVWRPGNIYVTNQRLVVFRRDPREMLWEADLTDIVDMNLQNELTIGGERRTRLVVQTADGESSTLSAAAPERIRDLVAAHIGSLPGEVTSAPAEENGVLLEGQMWYLERRNHGNTWRAGSGRLDRDHTFTWTGTLDRRPGVNLKPAEVSSSWLEPGRAPVGGDRVLRLDWQDDVIYLASKDIDGWASAFGAETGTGSGATDDAEVEHGARDR